MCISSQADIEHHSLGCNAVIDPSPPFFRYFDPTSGSIKLDGQDLRDVSLHSFRSYMAVVPQVTRFLSPENT